jgi:two-component system OmpR family response regulator
MKKRILIVDDEIDYLHIMKLLLEGMGQYQVRTVNLASQVAYVAREFRPDLILLDCMMPAMDGGEVAANLQSDPELKDIPFLFLTCTVSTVEYSRSQCYRGIQAFVPKTLDLEKLAHLIQEKLAA